MTHTTENYSSMDYWYPLCAPFGTPPTWRLQVRPDVELLKLMDSWPTDPADIFDTASCMVIKNHPYPLFLRSDQSADKHGYCDTCHVATRADFMSHVRNICEHNFMCGIWPTSFYIRDLLQVASRFTTFGGGLPIGAEARVFIRDGKIECVHPYWPEGAISSWVTDVMSAHNYRIEMARKFESPPPKKPQNLPPIDWRQLLLEDYATILDASHLVCRRAKKLARHIWKRREKIGCQYWSVDFLLDTDGRWWLTDMAEGDRSYHYPGCAKATDITGL